MCDFRHEDEAEYRRLLDEIGEEYCKDGCYCIFKEFLIAAHPSRRLLYQLKAMDKFKFERSKRDGKDIGWKATMNLWIEEGHAAKFAQCYADQKRFRDIYREIAP